jgi:hypothetical protein
MIDRELPCPLRVSGRFPGTVPTWHTDCAILARFLGGAGCSGNREHSRQAAGRQGFHGAERKQNGQISCCGAAHWSQHNHLVFVSSSQDLFAKQGGCPACYWSLDSFC